MTDQSQYEQAAQEMEAELKARGVALPANNGDIVGYVSELSVALKASLNSEIIQQARQQNRADEIDRTDIGGMRQTLTVTERCRAAKGAAPEIPTHSSDGRQLTATERCQLAKKREAEAK